MCLHRAWNSLVNTCLEQEGSCFASWAGDTEVCVNSDTQWQKTDVNLEDSLESTWVHYFG